MLNIKQMIAGFLRKSDAKKETDAMSTAREKGRAERRVELREELTPAEAAKIRASRTPEQNEQLRAAKRAELRQANKT